jgi:hypothetical protein
MCCEAAHVGCVGAFVVIAALRVGCLLRFCAADDTDTFLVFFYVLVCNVVWQQSLVLVVSVVPIDSECPAEDDEHKLL